MKNNNTSLSSITSSSSTSEGNDLDNSTDDVSQINGNSFSPSSNQIQTPVMNKRKRIRRNRKSYKRLSTNPALMPALRIFKRDIRRKYGDMMNNVFNNGDLKFVWKFFQDFCTPGLQTIHKTLCDELRSFNKTVIMNIEQAINMFRMNFIIMPDVIVRITNMKICKRSDCLGSHIIAMITKEGTMLYNMKKRNINMQQYSDLVNPRNSFDNCAILPVTNGVVEGPTADVILTPLETPINYFMKGIIIFNLDHEHRIISIDIEPIKE